MAKVIDKVTEVADIAEEMGTGTVAKTIDISEKAAQLLPKINEVLARVAQWFQMRNTRCGRLVIPNNCI